MFVIQLLLLIFLIATGSMAIKPTMNLIDGMDTSISRHPWMLSIRTGKGRHVCGASLLRVSPNLTRSDVALTAAHCYRGFIMLSRPLTGYVIAGAAVDTFDSTEGEKRRVVDVKNFGFFPGDDAAVIKLQSSIEFTDTIKPIELPAQGAEFPRDAQCTVTGWGLYQNHVLQELPVTIRGCDGRSFEYASNFCAGSNSGNACSGDSGGPLVCTEDGRHVQHGIVSYTDPSCGDNPATYARVSFYSDWIKQTVQTMTSLTV